MNLEYKTTTKQIDWNCVRNLLLKEKMATYEIEKHKRAFENSFKVIFVFDGQQLIGCGRLISDGAYQGAIYDVAIDSSYQGMGIGKTMVMKLLENEEDKNTILYATSGMEGFYSKLGFRKAKTGMCRFINPESAIQKGFIDEE